MAGQSNMITNGQNEFATIDAILTYFEQLLTNFDGEAKLSKELIKWARTNGVDHLSYNLINKKYAGEFDKLLHERQMPHIKMKDASGNFAYIVRDCDKDLFKQLQLDVFSMHPEFYASTDMNKITRAAERAGQNTMIKMEVDGESNLEILLSKLNQNGAGIVASVVENKHETQISPKKYTILINQNDVVKTKLGSPTNGYPDMAKLNLQWSLEHAFADYHDYRNNQAIYDMNEYKYAMNELAHGKSVAIADEFNESNKYIELSPSRITVWEKDAKSGTWQIQREIPSKEEGIEKMPIFDKTNPKYNTQSNRQLLSMVQSSIRASTKDIHNIRAIASTEISDHLKKTPKVLKQERGIRDLKGAYPEIAKWNKKVELDDTLSPEQKQKAYIQYSQDPRDVNLYSMKHEENDIDDENKNPNKTNTAMFLEYKEGESLPDRVGRPNIYLSNATKEDLQEFQWYKEKGHALIEAVNNIAHVEAMQTPGFHKLPPIEQIKRITDIQKDILIRNCPYKMTDKHRIDFETITIGEGENAKTKNVGVKFNEDATCELEAISEFFGMQNTELSDEFKLQLADRYDRLLFNLSKAFTYEQNMGFDSLDLQAVSIDEVRRNYEDVYIDYAAKHTGKSQTEQDIEAEKDREDIDKENDNLGPERLMTES